MKNITSRLEINNRSVTVNLDINWKCDKFPKFSIVRIVKRRDGIEDDGPWQPAKVGWCSLCDVEGDDMSLFSAAISKAMSLATLMDDIVESESEFLIRRYLEAA